MPSLSNSNSVALATPPYAGCRLVLHTELAPVRSRWLATLAAGAGSVFQTWEWNATWYETIGQRHGVLPRIIELRDPADQTRVLWPLGIYRRGRLRVLDFLGDVVTDYRAPILTPGFPGHDDPAAFEVLWRQVLKLAGRADAVDLRRMPALLDELANPMVGLRRARHTENAYSLRLPASVEQLHAQQSTKRLADNRRSLRRLADHGAVRIEPDHTDAGRDAVTQTMAEQKSRRWRETGSRDWFAEPGYLDFYRTLEFTETPGAQVNVASLAVGDACVATHWGLIFRGRHYWILPTYAEGPWTRYSCGRLLMQAMVEWDIAQGRTVFDLTVGDEAYKKDWVSEPSLLYRWRAALSVRGSLWLAGQHLREWARDQAWLRGAVRRLRGGRLKAPAAKY